MTIQVSSGDTFKDIKRCRIVFSDGHEAVFNSEETMLVYVNLLEVATLAMQKE